MPVIGELTVFLDSLNGVSIQHRYVNEIFLFHQLLAKDWIVKLEYIIREGNANVDVLAKMRVHSPESLVHSLCRCVRTEE